jgi:hypothetical protein
MEPRSLLPIIEAADNFKPASLSERKFVPFYLSLDHTSPLDIIGQIAPDVVKRIIEYPAGTFAIQPENNLHTAPHSLEPPSTLSPANTKAIAFDSRLSTPGARSEAIERACLEWRTNGLFAEATGGRQWRNEKYTIYAHPFKNIGVGGEIAFLLERSACELFGFVTYVLLLSCPRFCPGCD